MWNGRGVFRCISRFHRALGVTFGTGPENSPRRRLVLKMQHISGHEKIERKRNGGWRFEQIVNRSRRKGNQNIIKFEGKVKNNRKTNRKMKVLKNTFSYLTLYIRYWSYLQSKLMYCLHQYLHNPFNIVRFSPFLFITWTWNKTFSSEIEERRRNIPTNPTIHWCVVAIQLFVNYPITLTTCVKTNIAPA